MKTTTQMLAEIPELATEIQITTGTGAPNPSPRADRHIHTVPGSRPPLDLDTIDLLRTDPLDGLTIGKGPATSHLIDRLGLCVRMVAEERANATLNAPEPAYGTFAGTCGYLASTAPWWLAEDGIANDVLHEITQIHKTLERAARVPHEVIYRCRKCGHGRLWPQPGGEYMRCDTCGGDEPSAAKVREKIRSAKPMTAAAIEREWGYALGLTAKRISEWAHRGRLAPKGHILIDRKWRPIYEPWDVMQALQDRDGVSLAESG